MSLRVINWLGVVVSSRPCKILELNKTKQYCGNTLEIEMVGSNPALCPSFNLLNHNNTETMKWYQYLILLFLGIVIFIEWYIITDLLNHM